MSDLDIIHGGYYLTITHGLWLLKLGLKETHLILMVSSGLTHLTVLTRK